MASTIRFLHEVGYTYNGDAPIGGLTPAEFEVLTLGHLVRQEQAEEQQESARRGRKHTKPRRTTREALREFERNEIKAN